MYLRAGVTIAVIVFILLTIGFFIYKKILKGKKEFSFIQIVLIYIFICYIFALLKATLIGRPAGRRVINPYLFSSYMEAWYQWSGDGLLQLILNIAMFVPLGVFIPLPSEKFRKLWKAALIGLCTTLLIETAQYYTGVGLFEADDIFNNFLGTVIGYGLGMFALILFGKKGFLNGQKRKILLYLLPAIVTMVGISTVFIVYETQELGNMSDGYYHINNMKNVEITCDIELDDSEIRSYLYHSDVFTQKSAHEFAEKMFESSGASLSQDREPMLYYGCGYYYSDEGQILYIDYKYKSYKYTNGRAGSEKNTSASKEEIRKALAELGIYIPDTAEFDKDENGYYIFTVKMADFGDYLMNGTLECTYSSDGVIAQITSSLKEYTQIRECTILSEKEAFEQIGQGRFNYPDPYLYRFRNPFTSIEIVSLSLTHKSDSKGYYQPVYIFNILADGNDMKITIPALAK